jgi:hypothetical protein
MDDARSSHPWWRWLAWAVALLALLLVFAWYAQPGMVAELARQLWNCF